MTQYLQSTLDVLAIKVCTSEVLLRKIISVKFQVKWVKLRVKWVKFRVKSVKFHIRLVKFPVNWLKFQNFRLNEPNLKQNPSNRMQKLIKYQAKLAKFNFGKKHTTLWLFLRLMCIYDTYTYYLQRMHHKPWPYQLCYHGPAALTLGVSGLQKLRSVVGSHEKKRNFPHSDQAAPSLVTAKVCHY